MKRWFPTLLLALVWLFGNSSALAYTVKKYNLVDADGAVTPVEMTWSNFSGFGRVSGDISYPTGTINFSGSNLRTAFLTFEGSDGSKWELWRKRTSGQVLWEGMIHFENTAELVRLIPASVSNPLGYELTGSRTNVRTRTYTVTAAGVESKAVIYWYNFSGLGAVDGEFRLGDTVLKFHGKNFRSGYLDLEDAQGRLFSLRKSKTNRGKTRWSGPVVALSGEKGEIEMVAN